MAFLCNVKPAYVTVSVSRSYLSQSQHSSLPLPLSLHPTHMHARSIDTTNAKQLINICPKLLPPHLQPGLCCGRLVLLSGKHWSRSDGTQPTNLQLACQAFLHSRYHCYYRFGVKVTWATGIILHSKYTTNNAHLGKWNYTSFVLFSERYSVGKSGLARAKYLHNTLVPRSCLKVAYWMMEPTSQPAFSWSRNT